MIWRQITWPRLPVDRPWPTAIVVYLRRFEIFIWSGLVPLVGIGVLPLPGNPTGLILRTCVIGGLAIALLRAAQHRVFGIWQRQTLRKIRDMRHEMADLLFQVGRLAEGIDRDALASQVREELSDLTLLGEELAGMSGRPFAADSEALQSKLNAFAAFLHAVTRAGISPSL